MAVVFYEKNGVLNTLEFDATLKENHSSSLVITRHRVESSADVADHAYEEPTPVRLQVMITNTPIRAIGKLVRVEKPTPLNTDPAVAPTLAEELTREAKLYTGWVSPFRIPFGPRPYIAAKMLVPGSRARTSVRLLANVTTFVNNTDRVVDVWQEFRQLQKDRQLCDVLTKLEFYENMLLKEVTAPVEARASVTFDLVFEPYNTVESLTFAGVAKVQTAKTKTPAAKPVEDEGPKAAYDLEDDRQESLGRAGLNKLYGVK